MELKFEGLSDHQWSQIKPRLEPLFPSERKGRGRPSIQLRKAIDTIVYQFLTNEKWAYLPKGDQWATKSVANRILQVLKQNGLDIKEIASILGHNQIEK